MNINFSTYKFLYETLGSNLVHDFLNLFSNFNVRLQKNQKSVHFVIDKLDFDGIIEQIKEFFRKNKDNNVNITEPKKFGSKFEFDVVFN